MEEVNPNSQVSPLPVFSLISYLSNIQHPIHSPPLVKTDGRHQLTSAVKHADNLFRPLFPHIRRRQGQTSPANMALKATQGNEPYKYLGVINDESQNEGYVEYSTDTVQSKSAKFAVEYAFNEFVHIRSCLTNKYLIRSSTNGDWIVAQGATPMVETTSWMCTLFRMDIDDDKKATFFHVQSGFKVRIPDDGSVRKMFWSINPNTGTEAVSFVVDYDTLVVLPKLVAFKGSNDLFFSNYGDDGYPNFSVTDVGDPNIVCEIEYTSDGHVRVRSADPSVTDTFWTYSGPYVEDLIVVISEEYSTLLNQTFAVIRVKNNVVALRSMANNQICQRADVIQSRGKKDRLVATANGLLEDTYLEVVEPVISRTVNVYDFDLDKARIYNVSLIFSQEHTWDNHSDEVQSGSANGTISTNKSHTFSNNITVSGSVTTSFVTGIPRIAEGKIEVSASASYSREWGQTEEEGEEVGDTFTVVIKPMKRTIARGVATKGTCDVPFAYVQKDFPTNGGPPIVTKLYDGVFTGANAYSFYGDVRYEELPSDKVSSDRSITKVN